MSEYAFKCPDCGTEWDEPHVCPKCFPSEAAAMDSDGRYAVRFSAHGASLLPLKPSCYPMTLSQAEAAVKDWESYADTVGGHAIIERDPSSASGELLHIIRDGMQNMTEEQKQWPVVAMLAGPRECIEVIVRKAVQKSKIPMNWGYVGGRALVHSPGDKEKCRSALWTSIPQSDLSQADLCV